MKKANLKQSDKVTKHGKVIAHLMKYKTITSWQAIQLYGHTRIGQSILLLRRGGWDISTVPKTAHDRFNNECTYAQYLLVSTPKDSALQISFDNATQSLPTKEVLDKVGEFQQQSLFS
jgi:hypothetical protein